MTSEKNRSAIITGGARRLGAETAVFLASEGYDIALHYHTSERDAIITQKKIRSMGKKCLLFKGDLRDMAFVSELMRSAASEFEDMELMINSASVFKRATVMNTSEEIYQEIMDVNIKAPFFLIKGYAEIFGQGNIINIIDTKITLDQNVYAAYILSKKSLEDLTGIAAREFAPEIRVNGICPGLILPGESEDEEYITKLERRIPMGSKGDISNIKSVIKMIIENDFITGETIFVDGGEKLRT